MRNTFVAAGDDIRLRRMTKNGAIRDLSPVMSLLLQCKIILVRRDGELPFSPYFIRVFSIFAEDRNVPIWSTSLKKRLYKSSRTIDVRADM